MKFHCKSYLFYFFHPRASALYQSPSQICVEHIPKPVRPCDNITAFSVRSKGPAVFMPFRTICKNWLFANYANFILCSLSIGVRKKGVMNTERNGLLTYFVSKKYAKMRGSFRMFFLSFYYYFFFLSFTLSVVSE